MYFKPLTQYILRIADNSMVLGHRLSEWCGHGPVLEQDIALSNIALDLIGQARSYYSYAAQVEGSNYDEDFFPFLRKEKEFSNCLLVEMPNTDFGFTIARQFIFDTYHYYFLQKLTESNDEMLNALAIKSLKEVTYHLRYSSEWVLRLGDGTEESHTRIQKSFNLLWDYRNELVMEDELDIDFGNNGIGVDLKTIQDDFHGKIDEIIAKSTLSKPISGWNQTGGKKGKHTEHLGFLLTELQYLQRTYPNSKW
jgi:ring-1,2-phenylacetyl-CoA epoxidase subunit PaaC